MAEFVGSFAASHGPNIARNWETLKDETRTGWSPVSASSATA